MPSTNLSARLVECYIDAAAYGGYGVAHIPEGTVFVRGAYPGERIRGRITSRKRGVFFADVVDVLLPCADRTMPRCTHFGSCGGCHAQDLSHPAQLELKTAVLRDVLWRLGGIRFSPLSVLSASPFHYRHRVTMKVAPGGAVGFFRGESHALEAIRECPVLVQPLEDLVKTLAQERGSRAWLAGVRELRAVSGAQAGDILVECVTGRGRRVELSAQVPESVTRRLAGWRDGKGQWQGRTRDLALPLEGREYRVNTGSFFQAHWELNRKLVKLVSGWLHGAASVADLYGGSGNFALPVALNTAARVTVFERDPGALRRGRAAAREWGLGNVMFHQGDVAVTFPEWKPRAEAVIADPPRGGIAGRVLARLLAAGAEKIVYVSCDPATLARDLRQLVREYRIEEVTYVDFFPQTFHIEAAVLLVRQRCSPA